MLAVIALASIGVTLMGARRRTAASSHAAHSGK